MRVSSANRNLAGHIYQPQTGNPMLMPSRLIACLALSGVLALFVGTGLHPMHADPNHAHAAFAEYAADRHWVASHLLQLLGVALMAAALLLLAQRLHGSRAEPLARLAAMTTTAGLALAGALQAVDGIALKAMVDALATAPAGEHAALFHATFAVRQIEIGLASISCLLFGVSVCLYSGALWQAPQRPAWLPLLGLASGLPTAAAGAAMAYDGFSERVMLINMPANLLLLAWMLGLAWHAWHRPPAGV